MALLSFFWTPYDITRLIIADKMQQPSALHLVRHGPFRPRHPFHDHDRGRETRSPSHFVAVGIGMGIGVPLGAFGLPRAAG